MGVKTAQHQDKEAMSSRLRSLLRTVTDYSELQALLRDAKQHSLDYEGDLVLRKTRKLFPVPPEQASETTQTTTEESSAPGPSVPSPASGVPSQPHASEHADDEDIGDVVNVHHTPWSPPLVEVQSTQLPVIGRLYHQQLYARGQKVLERIAELRSDIQRAASSFTSIHHTSDDITAMGLSTDVLTARSYDGPKSPENSSDIHNSYRMPGRAPPPAPAPPVSSNDKINSTFSSTCENDVRARSSACCRFTMKTSSTASISSPNGVGNEPTWTGMKDKVADRHVGVRGNWSGGEGGADGTLDWVIGLEEDGGGEKVFGGAGGGTFDLQVDLDFLDGDLDDDDESGDEILFGDQTVRLLCSQT
eukprot:GEMP01053842.1.p1 GENE.GEMP01053842.1~~GEMP01053842.1.p1  ORF type:complete len:371 (+),score=75.80 GEMP01053842.1:33-1115(+)